MGMAAKKLALAGSLEFGPHVLPETEHLIRVYQADDHEEHAGEDEQREADEGQVSDGGVPLVSDGQAAYPHDAREKADREIFYILFHERPGSSCLVSSAVRVFTFCLRNNTAVKGVQGPTGAPAF